MDRILIILKKENGPRASSAPALGLKYYNIQTCLLVYAADSGERLQDHWSSGISKCLQKEGIVLGRKTVRDIILRYKDSHSIRRKPGSGRPTKVMNPRTLQIIESFMKSNDEATNKEIKEHLETLGLNVSIATIIRAKKMLGWTYQIPGYCQLIRHVNKTKRLNWAKENITENFEDAIWSDETSVSFGDDHLHTKF